MALNNINNELRGICSDCGHLEEGKYTDQGDFICFKCMEGYI